MKHACAGTGSIPSLLSAALLAAGGAVAPVAAAAQDADRPAFRFRTGVDLINVSATVTDRRGRFVSGLDKDDFLVYEDGVPQTLTHFSRERVPVSLGIVLDTSGSMEGERMAAARSALARRSSGPAGREPPSHALRPICPTSISTPGPSPWHGGAQARPGAATTVG